MGDARRRPGRCVPPPQAWPPPRWAGSPHPSTTPSCGGTSRLPLRGAPGDPSWLCRRAAPNRTGPTPGCGAPHPSIIAMSGDPAPTVAERVMERSVRANHCGRVSRANPTAASVAVLSVPRDRLCEAPHRRASPGLLIGADTARSGAVALTVRSVPPPGPRALVGSRIAVRTAWPRRGDVLALTLDRSTSPHTVRGASRGQDSGRSASGVSR